MPLRTVVAQLAEPGDVGAAAAGEEARSLGEVGARLERRHEAGDLGRVGRAVGVDHHDQVPGHGGEAGAERVALADPGSG